MKRGLDSISDLTKMHLTIYDDSLRLMASSSNHDGLLSIIKSDDEVHALYREFIKRQLKLAPTKHEPFFVQGLTGQYHGFIPLLCGGKTLIAVAEAFYMSDSDFKKFYFSNQGRAVGITEKPQEEWLQDIRIYSFEEIAEILKNTGSVLRSLATSQLDNDKLNKYSGQLKTIISIMSDMNSDYSLPSIYQIMIEAVIFLFETDTAAILIKKGNQYVPQVIEGKCKPQIRDMVFSDENRIIAKVASAEAPVTLNGYDLLDAGFSDNINLMTAFPLSYNESTFGFLAVFNTPLEKEACESIINLCRLTSYVCGVRYKESELESASERLNMLSLRASSLYSIYRERRLLHEAIVKEISAIIGAEKCSLMMSDDKGMLEVIAASGINRRLMENVRVRPGEGISGKAYQQGVPVLITGEKDLNHFGTTPRSHYKTASALSIPLKVADEVLGVVNLSDKHSGVSFAKTDISMLSPFLLQASAVLKLGTYHEALEQMTKLSMTDPLTGLFNRRYFDMRLEEEYLRAKRYNLALSLAVMDIDDFKPFNDTEGHPAGDNLLKEVSSIMTSSIRSHDILTRLGGEEFAIIMPQTGKSEAFNVLERIRENIKSNIKPAWKEYHKSRLTISSGIATYPECSSGKDDLMRCADKALYKAKSLGKDRTVSWE